MLTPTHSENFPDADLCRRLLDPGERALHLFHGGRVVTLNEATRLTSEIKLARQQLAELAREPSNAAATAHLKRVLLKLDSLVSARFWAMSQADAVEWKTLRARIITGPGQFR